jgi:hypothetical protein
MIIRKSVLAGAAICILGVSVIFLLTLPERPTEQGRGTEDSATPSQKTDKPADTPSMTSSLSPAKQERKDEATEAAVSPHQAALHARLQELEISPHVRTIIGLDKSDFNTRRAAMKKLTRELPEGDIKALKLFLDFRYKDNNGERLLVFEGFKNDALDVLLRQEKLPPGVGIQLVEMFRDTSHSDVWRDYCIQYLATYCRRKWPARKQLPDYPESQAIEQMYWDAAEQADKSFAGTALIGLNTLSQTFTNIPTKKVEEIAVSLAKSDSTAEPTRITALIMASKMGRAEVVPEARMLSQIGDTTTLRMAAIASLGRLGSKEDIELVRSLLESPEKRIVKTAKSALQRLRNRTAESPSPFGVDHATHAKKLRSTL